ncbi:MAG: hypothetical protein IJG56_03145 [Clostridia bacterium]|nr:hypothetical protein [Clostridia bacterium]
MREGEKKRVKKEGKTCRRNWEKKSVRRPLLSALFCRIKSLAKEGECGIDETLARRYNKKTIVQSGALFQISRPTHVRKIIKGGYA